MKEIKITFTNGAVISAGVRESEEPELAESMQRFFEEPKKLICHNTLSTGDSFAAFPRPPKSPVKAGHLGKTIGRNRLHYTELKAGDLIWSGTKLYVCYGKCTEPGLIGAVVAQVKQEEIPEFVRACNDVRNHTYFYHKMAVITVERGN